MKGQYRTRDLETDNDTPITKLRLKLLDFDGPQYMLAALAGIAPARISEYSLGRRRIPMQHVYRLCEVLKCDPRDIVGVVDDEGFDSADGE